MVLIKHSAYRDMLQRLGLTEEQSVYNGAIGHIGEQDSIINIIQGLEQGRLQDGDLMAIVAPASAMCGVRPVFSGDCV
jgi:3-oxoacyl-[acyl-carrier-protein] synthase-3